MFAISSADFGKLAWSVACISKSTITIPNKPSKIMRQNFYLFTTDTYKHKCKQMLCLCHKTLSGKKKYRQRKTENKSNEGNEARQKKNGFMVAAKSPAVIGNQFLKSFGPSWNEMIITKSIFKTKHHICLRFTTNNSKNM